MNTILSLALGFNIGVILILIAELKAKKKTIQELEKKMMRYYRAYEYIVKTRTIWE
jgi:hypothetical protein